MKATTKTKLLGIFALAFLVTAGLYAGEVGYGDEKPEGIKSYGGSAIMIKFELPKEKNFVKGLKIHGSRYGAAKAPKEYFNIYFTDENNKEILAEEKGKYGSFKRTGKQKWVTIRFKKPVELPKTFWVVINFNAHQTKGVYVSYDTSTKGVHSKVGLPGEKSGPTGVDGDWMIKLITK